MSALSCYGFRRLSRLPEGTMDATHKTNGFSHRPPRSASLWLNFRHKISPIFSGQIEGRRKKIGNHLHLFSNFCPEVVWGVVSYCMAVLRSASPFQLITTGWGEGRFKWWGTMLNKRIYVHIYTRAISIYRSHTQSPSTGVSCRAAVDTRQQHALDTIRVTEGVGSCERRHTQSGRPVPF